MIAKRLRLVIFQDAPGVWHARVLEHDLAAEGSTIGQAVRTLARALQVHAEYDTRHHHPPLVAFPPSAQRYWNAFATGTAVPLGTLGITPPEGWVFQAAFAIRLPGESRHQATRIQMRA
ncbi:MAG TPA: hypothetical protein VGY57_01605 [Vicinamibacterales bacterium]|nr:hypothetical protein [Vicinamibacterales bacterium]